jgi:WS/DGAT/MGAT family acyltransferase
VIEGLRDGRVALLTKIHHAAVDGMSGAEILSVLLDPSPEGRAVPPAEDVVGHPPPGELRMLARGLAGLPRQPLRALAAMPRTLPHLDSVPTIRHLPGVGTLARVTRRKGPVPTAPRTRFQGAITPHRRVAFGSLSLDDVKAIKNAAGCTVNDVVMTVCAGALRDWLAERGELPADPLLTMVPVSVRTDDERGTFGNRISTMIVPLPTDEPDPVARLQRVHEAMRSAKERHRAMPATLLQDANHFIPPALFARAARVTSRVAVTQQLKAPLNLVISNVPGSPAPLYCAGATLEAHYPVSAIIDGVGLNITVLSYQDRLDFGVVADRDMLDDAWEIIERLRASLDELRAYPVSARARSARSPRRSSSACNSSRSAASSACKGDASSMGSSGEVGSSR